MIREFFKGTRLGVKILSLPGIVSAFMLVVGIITIAQLASVKSGVEQINSVQAPTADSATKLLRNVLQKDQTIQQYLRTGDENLIRRSSGLKDGAGKLVTSMRQTIQSEAKKSELDQLRAVSAEYDTVFSTVVVPNMTTQLTLGQDLLADQGPAITKLLSDVIATAVSDGEAELANAGISCLKNFLTAGVYFGKFLLDNVERDIERYRNEMMAAEGGYYDLEADSEGRRAEWVATLISAMEKYNANAEEVVTAIGARNTAVTEQITPHSEKIAGMTVRFQEGVWDDLRVNNEEISASLSNTNAIVITATLIAIAVGLVLALVISRAIVRPIQSAVEVISKISDGDLTAEIEVTSRDETGQLLESMQSMNQRLKELVGGVLSTSNDISSSASEVSSGSVSLSQRTERQAASLEETASSMEQMTSTVKMNAGHANDANAVVQDAADTATRGGVVVRDAKVAMDAINDSNKRVADIINVIDEISFQTNLLALNAAVEAAHAGDHGRGFAVVASAVHKLAERSAIAAKEIKDLIEDNGAKVQNGSELVSESGRVLNEIVESVGRVKDFVAEIVSASAEQASGIDQVNQAVVQLDTLTQSNASLVHDSSLTSRALDQQAERLVSQMGYFKVGAAQVDN